VVETKIETLKAMVGGLQEKIAMEVAAQEELTREYEKSMNRGLQSLNRETSPFIVNKPFVNGKTRLLNNLEIKIMKQSIFGDTMM
jgi:hypothetical protein